MPGSKDTDDYLVAAGGDNQASKYFRDMATFLLQAYCVPFTVICWK